MSGEVIRLLTPCCPAYRRQDPYSGFVKKQEKQSIDVKPKGRNPVRSRPKVAMRLTVADLVVVVKKRL